jgi:hypothetical protein
VTAVLLSAISRPSALTERRYSGLAEVTFCGIIHMTDNLGRARHSVRAALCQQTRSGFKRKRWAMDDGSWRRGQAAEGRRTPRREAFTDDLRTARSVLECASPLALWEDAQDVRGGVKLFPFFEDGHYCSGDWLDHMIIAVLSYENLRLLCPSCRIGTN